MKLREIMSSTVVRIHPEETVAVAARMLEHNNIGALPVCGGDGRLLIFLPANLIPAWDSSQVQVFHMMYSAYKLNKRGDNIQP